MTATSGQAERQRHEEELVERRGRELETCEVDRRDGERAQCSPALVIDSSSNVP